MYPIQVPGILEGTAFFAQAAIEERVGFIVNMSQISARRAARAMLLKVSGLQNVCLTGRESLLRIYGLHSLQNG